MSEPIECPSCRVSLIGAEIPPKDREHFGGKLRFSRAIAIYDFERDRTVMWQCPDCEWKWKR